MVDLYLASGSPRRRELLDTIGVRFERISADIDESLLPGEAPDAYVVRLARAKAVAGLACVQQAGGAVLPVLGADTSVVCGGRVLGKPVDRDDALAMLAFLSGRGHEVMTAVAIATADDIRHVLSVTRVHFREIGRAEAEAYWASGECQDKAGAYGIQGRGGIFVAALEGSYSGVVGLPVFETAELLKLYKVPRWLHEAP